jgi:hypothetical protein
VINNLLERLSKGEGLWAMAMTALATLAILLTAGKFSGTEFVSAFSVWVTTVFGSAAIAGFRDWKKP